MSVLVGKSAPSFTAPALINGNDIEQEFREALFGIKQFPASSIGEYIWPAIIIQDSLKRLNESHMKK